MRGTVVFDNIIFSLQKAGGISAFWANLISRVDASGRFDCYFIEYPGATDNIFRRELHIPSRSIIAGKHLPFSLERVLEPYIPPQIIRRGHFIFHSSYYRLFTGRGAINVSTFHDLTHEHGGDGNFLTRPLMRRVHSAALRKSRHVVCVSRHCLSDIRAHFPNDCDTPMSVAYNAPVCPVSGGDLAAEGAGDYLFFVGARDRYKNFRFAVELAASCGLPLKVAGAPFSPRERRWLSSRKASHVSLIPFPDGAELSRLYRGARALVFMSEYEGFGIPVAEAQAAGCPVIALARSAVPEIIGRGGVLLDSPDPEKARSAVERLAADLLYRNALIAEGKKNARRFSWDRTAEHYMSVYSDLLKTLSR